MSSVADANDILTYINLSETITFDRKRFVREHDFNIRNESSRPNIPVMNNQNIRNELSNIYNALAMFAADSFRDKK
jgi:hypothetical protein